MTFFYMSLCICYICYHRAPVCSFFPSRSPGVVLFFRSPLFGFLTLLSSLRAFETCSYALFMHWLVCAIFSCKINHHYWLGMGSLVVKIFLVTRRPITALVWVISVAGLVNVMDDVDLTHCDFFRTHLGLSYEIRNQDQVIVMKMSYGVISQLPMTFLG